MKVPYALAKSIPSIYQGGMFDIALEDLPNYVVYFFVDLTCLILRVYVQVLNFQCVSLYFPWQLRQPLIYVGGSRILIISNV